MRMGLDKFTKHQSIPSTRRMGLDKFTKHQSIPNTRRMGLDKFYCTVKLKMNNYFRREPINICKINFKNLLPNTEL
jgi:hypothetical protein